MTDEELIARLRHYAQIAHAAAAWGFAGEGEIMNRAADRIEALVKQCEGLAQAAMNNGQALILAEARAERLEAALHKLHHAVCGETGFAACVRLDSGKAYPWPALDDADETARAALKGADHE